MISFLFPALLAGLAAIAVPIIIHFFYRRQLKVVPISTLRFLKIADETLPRQPIWKHWLLLVLRCLLVALLVFFLAKPYFASGAAAAKKPLHRVVLLDRSLSMTVRDAEKSSFETARKIAADLTRGVRYQDTITPIVFDQNPVPLAEAHGSDHPRVDAAFRGAKTRVSITSPQHALRAALRFCNEPSPRPSRNEVIVLTDLRAADVPEWVDGAEVIRDAKDLSRVVVVNCGVDSKPNFAVTSTRLVPLVSSSAASHALAITVSCSVAQPFEKKVEVAVNDQPPTVVTLRAENGTSASAEVPLPSAVGGLWRGSVRLLEEDPLAEDNQRFFCFKPSRSDRIFLVDGAPSNIRSLSETYYLGVALGTLPEERALDVTVGPLDKLPWDGLDKLGTILFANVAKFSADESAKLGAFVRGGGNVIFTLGDQIDPASYNRVLRAGRPDDVFPSSLGAIHGDPGKRLELFFLGEVDPGFDGFNLGDGTDLDAFRQVRFFAYYELEKPDANSIVIARFNTGHPAVLAKDVGDGHVYLFASSVAAVWNDFPLRPTYLPFWRNFLSYLAHLGAPPRQFRVGETARLHRSARDANGEKLFALGPDKLKLVPIVTKDSVLVPNVERPGLYRIVDAGGTERDPGFAVNVPARESQTAPATPEDLARLKGAGYEVIGAADASAIEKLTRAAGQDAVPLAAWVALLAVVAAAGEWVYANHLSREGNE